MKQCDLCKCKIKDEFALCTLTDAYKFRDIEEVCKTCMDELERAIFVVNSAMQKEVTRLKRRFFRCMILRRLKEYQ